MGGKCLPKSAYDPCLKSDYMYIVNVVILHYRESNTNVPFSLLATYIFIIISENYIDQCFYSLPFHFV